MTEIVAMAVWGSILIGLLTICIIGILAVLGVVLRIADSILDMDEMLDQSDSEQAPEGEEGS